MDQDFSKLIAPDEVKKFNNSAPARQAVKLLGLNSLETPLHITESDYVLIRDFLLVKIVFNNANRSGILVNMTTTQFQDAQLVNDHHVISVTDHKTAATHGPATIILTPVLFGWFSIFAKAVISVCERAKQFIFIVPWGSYVKWPNL